MATAAAFGGIHENPGGNRSGGQRANQPVRAGIHRKETSGIRVHLLGNLLVVRLQRVLTAAEQHLATSLASDEGRDLLKQVRTHLVEVARPQLEQMITEVTGVGMVSMHHDISTISGEEMLVFLLDRRPKLREPCVK